MSQSREPYGWIRPLKPNKYGKAWQYYAGPAKAGVWVFGAAYSELAARRAALGALSAAGFPNAPIHVKQPYGKWAA